MTLRVRRALQRIDGKLKLKEPKTEKIRRTLPLPAALVPALKVHRDRQAFEKLAAEGLPRQRFHDLRHCAASLIPAQGVPMRVVMDILGHSQIATTMDIYSHVMPAAHRDAADLMDRILAAKG